MNIRHTIYEYIKQFFQDDREVWQEVSKTSIVAEVISVDEEKRTCELRPINGDSDRYDVRLQADLSLSEGMVVIPVERSNVTMVYTNECTGVIVGYSKIQKFKVTIGESDIEITDGLIQFDGGEKGKVAISEKVVERLNLIEQDIKDLKQAFNAWQPTDGGGALKTASSTWATNALQETENKDIENENITQ